MQTVVTGFVPAPGSGQPNLHSVWDSVLLGQRGLDEIALTEALLRRMASEPIAAWMTTDVVAWTMEAHELARRYAYAYPDMSTEGPGPVPVRLDSTYQRVAEPIIDLQLMRAGVRLAHVLNEAATRRRGAIDHAPHQSS